MINKLFLFLPKQFFFSSLPTENYIWDKNSCVLYFNVMSNKPLNISGLFLAYKHVQIKQIQG